MALPPRVVVRRVRELRVRAFAAAAAHLAIHVPRRLLGTPCNTGNAMRQTLPRPYPALKHRAAMPGDHLMVTSQRLTGDPRMAMGEGGRNRGCKKNTGRHIG